MDADIFRIAAAAVIAAVLAVTIKKDNPSFALLIVIAASVIIVMSVFPRLAEVIGILRDIGSQINANAAYILIIIKIIGISYVAEFGAQICMDAGETAIASKVELAGKIIIMAVSAPILLTLIQQILGFLP